MANERAEALRRTHVQALPLLEVLPAAGREAGESADVDFVVGLPDGRVRAALAVFFVPQILRPFPSDAIYAGFLDTGRHGLAVVAREKPAEQGQGLYFCDRVFGTLSAPVPLPGDTFGWLVSAEADAREWYCRLHCALEAGVGVSGYWLARVTYTARADMSPDEWRRQADRIYLRRALDGGPVPTLLHLPEGPG